MKLLEERILKEGHILPGNILKVELVRGIDSERNIFLKEKHFVPLHSSSLKSIVSKSQRR